ncbi:MAG: HXXEE domain-containing protein [Pseudomonadota bacterium]
MSDRAPPGPFERAIADWAPGTGLAALLMLWLTPALAEGWSWALIAAWMPVPIYMVHQWEEHDGGRFGAFVNKLLGGEQPVLTPEAIFLINVPIVWGLTGVGFLFAVLIGPAWGLLGLYALVTNGLVHVAQAVAFRQSNPGLITAVSLFLPIGFWGLWLNGDAGILAHIAALAVSIGIHAGIVVHALRRMKEEE